MVEVLHDRADLGEVEFRVVDEESDHRDPEVLRLERPAQSGGDDRKGQCPRPAQPPDLAPPQRRLHREVVRGLEEVVGHHLGVRERQVGRADVPPGPDECEPALLSPGLGGSALEPHGGHEGGDRVGRQEVPGQRRELRQRVDAGRHPILDRPEPVEAGQREEAGDEYIAAPRPGPPAGGGGA